MRTRLDRIRHAILFETIGLVAIMGILSQLGFELGHVGAMGVLFSVVLDIGMVVFYLLYAYGYNLVYDKLFPVPEMVVK